MYFRVVIPLVNAVSELGCHEEGLQQTVHVTSGADIGKAFISFFHLLCSNFELFNFEWIIKEVFD